MASFPLLVTTRSTKMVFNIPLHGEELDLNNWLYAIKLLNAKKLPKRFQHPTDLIHKDLIPDLVDYYRSAVAPGYAGDICVISATFFYLLGDRLPDVNDPFHIQLCYAEYSDQTLIDAIEAYRLCHSMNCSMLNDCKSKHFDKNVINDILIASSQNLLTLKNMQSSIDHIDKINNLMQDTLSKLNESFVEFCNNLANVISNTSSNLDDCDQVRAPDEPLRPTGSTEQNEPTSFSLALDESSVSDTQSSVPTETSTTPTNDAYDHKLVLSWKFTFSRCNISLTSKFGILIPQFFCSMGPRQIIPHVPPWLALLATSILAFSWINIAWIIRYFDFYLKFYSHVILHLS